MSLTAVFSAKGSPGVTTLACLLGALWPLDSAVPTVFVAECDPSGADIAARFGIGQHPGITSLALALRHPGDLDSLLARHAQELPGGLQVLVGPVGSEAARALDVQLAGVADLFARHACPVVADCGRLDTGARGQLEMIRRAEPALLVVQPEVPAVAHARAAVEWLTGAAGLDRSRFAFVMSGQGKLSAREVESFMGLECLGALPRDGRAADIACGRPAKAKSLESLPLVKALRALLPLRVQLCPAERPDPARGSRQAGVSLDGFTDGTTYPAQLAGAQVPVSA